MARFSYGGQALIEGVLMRGRDAIAVAFRHPDGHIVWASESLDKGPHAWRFAKTPFVRGLIVLYETLIVGTRWLIRSANLQASAEGIELGKGSVAVMLGVTLVAGVGIFFLLPLFLAALTAGKADSGWVQHLTEGLIRVGIFLGYLALISRAPDIRRVFEYHGAEHMTIHAYEAQKPLTVANVRPYPKEHTRCGTSFLLIVVIVALITFFVFDVLVDRGLVIRVASRIVFIPLVAGVSYEILRVGARWGGNVFVKAMFVPNIALQALTTKKPDDSQIEVAIASFEAVLEASGMVAAEGRTSAMQAGGAPAV
jgi:uncharacterized protein YqhQ